MSCQTWANQLGDSVWNRCSTHWLVWNAEHWITYSFSGEVSIRANRFQAVAWNDWLEWPSWKRMKRISFSLKSFKAEIVSPTEIERAKGLPHPGSELRPTSLLNLFLFGYLFLLLILLLTRLFLLLLLLLLLLLAFNCSTSLCSTIRDENEKRENLLSPRWSRSVNAIWLRHLPSKLGWSANSFKCPYFSMWFPWTLIHFYHNNSESLYVGL